MIIFDKEKYVKQIVKDHIAANAIGVRSKLTMVAKYYLTKTYKPFKIKAMLRKIGSEWFKGLPEQIINDEIEEIFNSARKSTEAKEADDIDDNDSDCELIDEEDITTHENETEDNSKNTVTIYEEELKKIRSLSNKNAENLAFIFLVVYKFFGYEWVYECNSDIYRLAELRASGNTKIELHYLLTKNKLVRFNSFVKTKKSKQKEIAETKFKVLFCLDNSDVKKTVAFSISDYDDLILYYRHYVGDENIIECAECGRPIKITGNSKKYCNDCAYMAKHDSNMRSKIKKVG